VAIFPLISAEDAIMCMASDKTVFFDASFHLASAGRDADQEFIDKRIAAAQRFDINHIARHDTKLPHTMPTAPLFQRHMQSLGVNQDSHVIVYDDAATFSSARAWFMLRYFGFGSVQILDGGLKKWIESGGKTANGTLAEMPPRGDFRSAEPIDSDGILSIHTMKRLVEKPVLERKRQIIDARSAERFYGRAPEPRAGLASGHMPGAINIPFDEVLNRDTGLVKSKAELERIFEDIAPGQHLVTTCGSGVTACVLILALTIIGRENIALYDGSWAEWGSREGCPISV
jgi:thiosulfate/3-mercaptopyruvate sulfurtransferase